MEGFHELRANINFKDAQIFVLKLEDIWAYLTQFFISISPSPWVNNRGIMNIVTYASMLTTCQKLEDVLYDQSASG